MTEEKNESPFLVKWVAIILWIAIGIQGAFLMPNGHGLSSSNGSQPRNLKITNPSSAPIILMGLPRSGSLALHEYFQCQGMTSRHYCCGDIENSESSKNLKASFPCPKHQETCGNMVLENLKTGTKKAFDATGDTTSTTTHSPVQVWSAFDVETDQGWFLPQHFTLGLLHEQYPNAIWVLNTRGSPNVWAKSIYHWHSLTRRFLHSFGHLKQDQGIWDEMEPISVPKPDRRAHVTAEQVEQDLERSVARTTPTKLQEKGEEIQSLLEEIYQKHTDTIRNWSRQFPSHRLIEINVDEDSSTIQSRLDRAFGINYSRQGGSHACHFQFDPPDNDWQDFSLPY